MKQELSGIELPFLSLLLVASSSSKSMCWVLALYKTGTTTTTVEIVSFSLVC